MFGRNLQQAIASFAACCALAAVPTACHAQLFGGCCNRGAPTTTYRPLFAPAAPVAQSVSYMPYTAYRTVYTNMPVTAYQPVAACGPCGTPTTVMRPVTAYALQPQLVPFTTYRPVVTSVNACYSPVAPACGTCGVAAAPVGVPVVASQMATSSIGQPYYAPPSAGACSGCAAAPPTPMINPGMPGSTVPGLPNINAPPSLPAGQPIPQANSTFAPNGTTTAPPAAGYPGAANYPGQAQQYASPPPPSTQSGSSPAAAGSTFNGSAPGKSSGAAATSGAGATSGAAGPSGSSAAPQSDSRLRQRVIPDVAPPPTNYRPDAGPDGNGPNGLGSPNGDDSMPKNNGSGVEGQKTNLQQPKLLNPEDRMTARPLPNRLYKPVSGPVVQAGATEPAPLGDDGWRAATAAR